MGPIGPTGAMGPVGPQGPRGETGATGPSPVVDIGSVANVGGIIVPEGQMFTFDSVSAMRNVTLNGMGATLTLGNATYYNVSMGFTVTGSTGTPVVSAIENGVNRGRDIQVTAEGGYSIEWTAEYGPNTTIQFLVQDGTLNISSAYVNVLGFAE